MESMVKNLKQSLRSGSPGKRKEKDSQEKSWFLENGSIFLKELIADCNGKSIPIRSFTSSQILISTKNFDSSCFVTEDGDHKLYKSIIEDKSYLIKRFYEDRDTEGRDVYNDIVLSARMSNHNNFLKLLGCCLEFPSPVLVFENAEHGVLNSRGRVMVNGEESILPWSVRLKIAKEIANAVTYLHTAFPKITIHRDVKPASIVLDKNWTAKLSGLSICITLPEGKSKVETLVIGTLGYLDPSYFITSFVTEYTDVYAFGVFLMVMLTGRPALGSTRSHGECKHIAIYVKGLYEKGKLDELIDPLMEENTGAQGLQVDACVVLALRCCAESNEDRPKMIQVAQELKRIQTSF